jgi:DHA2 family multidrug resistance protein-like MFS transporter
VQLPGPLGAELLDAAHDAFATALNVAAGVGALLFIGLAVVTVTMLRRHHGDVQPRTA